MSSIVGLLVLCVQSATAEGPSAWDGFKEGSSATYACVVKVAGKETGTLEETRKLSKREGKAVTISIDAGGKTREVVYGALANAEFQESGMEELTVDGTTFACKIWLCKNDNGTAKQWRTGDGQVIKEEVKTKRTTCTTVLTKLKVTLDLGKKYVCWTTKTTIEGDARETREGWYSAEVPGLEVMKSTRTTIGNESVEMTWKLVSVEAKK